MTENRYPTGIEDEAALPPSRPISDERLEAVDTRLNDWGRKLDRFLEQADRSVASGRELVEQRALNLDLQRQVHRLEEEIRSLRAASGTGIPDSGSGSLREVSAPGATAAADKRDRRSILSKLVAAFRGS